MKRLIRCAHRPLDSPNSVTYDMVGRYGGEEFLVILNNRDPSGAMLRAEILRTAISSRPVQTRSLRVPVTISIGMAISIDFANREVDEIIQEADTALYAAKSAGRNCIRMAHPREAAGKKNDLQGKTSSLTT